MIDVEIDVFNEVAEAILAEYPDAYVCGEYVVSPPQFPAVSVIQTLSVEDKSRVDSSGEENANALTYDVNVYSNSESDSKKECKSILQVADKALRARNFRRTTAMPIDNAQDPSIYRMTARYVGLVDKHLVHYER